MQQPQPLLLSLLLLLVLLLLLLFSFLVGNFFNCANTKNTLPKRTNKRERERIDVPEEKERQKFNRKKWSSWRLRRL